MTDDRMFSQLMTDSRRRPEPTASPAMTSKKKVLHLSVNLPSDQAEIVDRYYSLLYPTDRRATRSAFIGLAIEVLDRILDGAAPERLDASVLDAYARTRAGSHARTPARGRTQEE
jgi:hypothetical protein